MKYSAFKDCLDESTTDKSIVFTFGRFQPPTSGHERLVDKVVSVARKFGAEAAVYLSPSEGGQKNPLPLKDKEKYMKSFFGRSVDIYADSKFNNPFYVMKNLSDQGYKKVYLVVGSDRVSELKKNISKYIGHSDKSKSFDFTEFDVVSAGERDPDSEGVGGMSASKMRAAVVEGDYAAFKSGLPSTANSRSAKSLYDKLRDKLDVSEDYDLFDMIPLSVLLEEESDSSPPKAKKVKQTLLVLTTQPSGSEEYPKTVEKMIEVANGMGYKMYPVSIDHAFIPDDGIGDNSISIHDYYNNNKVLKIFPKNTTVFVRGSAVMTNAGQGLLKILEISGAKMINDSESMDMCRNKYLTSIILKQNKIPIPRTTLINDESDVALAHKSVGGKFPVILKTITGAEGIGVSKIESFESLKSVLQSMWKHEAEMVMQEYMEIKFDVRTIVFDGEPIGSLKRIKGKKDFRTNVSLGNTSKPYKLNDKETRIILDAARASQCRLSGVDHILTSDGIKVLEVNGSPGFNAPSYMLYPEKETGDGRDVLKKIIQQSLINKNLVKSKDVDVIGYFENFELKDIGKVHGKIDTGNEGHSVLHATDINIKGGMVTFKTTNQKTLKLPITSTITIHIGSGKVEKRPTVEIDTHFVGKDIGKIRYSLADRSQNSAPLLISRKMISALEIQIDPSTSYILGEESDTDREFSQFILEQAE